MADPRLSVEHGEIGARFETYKHDSSIVYSATTADGSSQVGLAVKIASADTVGLTTAASHVFGKLIKVESDTICVVQTKGVMTLPAGTGHAANNVITVGSQIVGDLSTAAEGYIKGVTTNAWNADQQMGSGKVRDVTTTTAVEVEL